LCYNSRKENSSFFGDFNEMVNLNECYGLETPLQPKTPLPIEAKRAPISTDKNFILGQMWIDTTTGILYVLTSVSAGQALWSITAAGAGDLETINGLLPDGGGNIVIDGGLNITDSNAGNTVTLNLDDVITVGTSVSSPLFTSDPADVLTLLSDNVVVIRSNSGLGNAIDILAAAGGINISSFGGSLVDRIDVIAVAGIRLDSSEITASALTFNSSDLAGGMDFNAGTSGITMDTTGSISLDGAGADCNFSVAGPGVDLNLESSDGSVNLTAAEAVSDAVVISASDAAGGITFDAGSAGVNVTGATLDVQGGDIQISGAAQQLQVEGGTVTDFIGQATLVAGVATILNTNIAATDRIFVTRSALNASTEVGEWSSVITPGVNFTVTSLRSTLATAVLDLSTFDYFIVRQL
jgi:hypothetical protein